MTKLLQVQYIISKYPSMGKMLKNFIWIRKIYLFTGLIDTSISFCPQVGADCLYNCADTKHFFVNT